MFNEPVRLQKKIDSINEQIQNSNKNDKTKLKEQLKLYETKLEEINSKTSQHETRSKNS